MSTSNNHQHLIDQLTTNLIGQVFDESQQKPSSFGKGYPIFPLFLGPKNISTDSSNKITFVQLQEYFIQKHETILKAASEFGAVMFKGFDIKSGNEWASILYHSGIKEMNYVGGAAVRKLIVGNEKEEHLKEMQVLTTNESPPSQPIPFHHELAQTPDFPSHICFFCVESDCKGGSTPLVRSDLVVDWLEENHPEFTKKMEEVGVKYVRVAPGQDDPKSALGRSWRSMFHCQKKEEAETAASKQGSVIEWLENNEEEACRIVTKLPAIRVSSNGRKSFLNQVVAAYFGWVDSRNKIHNAVRFGDDSPIPLDVMEALQKFMVDNSCVYKWTASQFVIVDNTVAYHSREPFKGRRRVLASIGKGTKSICPDLTCSTTSVVLPNGARMPMAGFGCWKVPKDVCASTVYSAIKAGYRLFDNACDYGNEKQVGEGISKAIADGLVKREDLFIVSKLWNTYHHPDKVKLACEKTLADLGLAYVDLYLIHFPIHLKFVPFGERYPPEWIHDPKAAQPRMEFEQGVTYQMTWTAMEGLVDAGLAKNIGFCNIGCHQIREVLQYARVKPAVLQVELHPFLTQDRLLRYCRENGIAVMAFSSFGASSYVELGMADASESLLDNANVKAIAESVKRSPGQVLLRWAVQRGTIVIPKTSKPERLTENLSLFDFELTEEQMKSLDGMNKNRRYNDPGFFCEKAFNTFCPIYD